MKANRLLTRASLLFGLAAILFPAVAHARTFQPPTWAAAMRGAGYTIPAEWSGIWVDTDSTYSCTPRVFLETTTDTDTLCAGSYFGPDTTGGGDYDCTGTITATTIDLTCTGSFTFEDCTATFDFHFEGSRTGDTSIVTATFNSSYSPPGCAFQPDDCQIIVTRSTRIAPQPPGCLTSVERSTWGQVKARYR